MAPYPSQIWRHTQVKQESRRAEDPKKPEIRSYQLNSASKNTSFSAPMQTLLTPNSSYYSSKTFLHFLN